MLETYPFLGDCECIQTIVMASGFAVTDTSVTADTDELLHNFKTNNQHFTYVRLFYSFEYQNEVNTMQHNKTEQNAETKK